MTQRLRDAQNQLNLAAYEAEEAARTLRRVDGVMDAGGWGHAEKAEAQQALQRLVKAHSRVSQAILTMGGGIPMGVAS